MRDGSTRRGRVWGRAVMGAAVVLVGLGIAAGLSAGPPEPAVVSAAPAGPQIEIKEHKYRPATLTVQAGTTVTWVNHDEDVHTVTSSSQAFASRGIDTDETFAYTFTKPGTYTYFCSLHPLMNATIVVK